MAELARQYHDELQFVDVPRPDDDHDEYIREVLRHDPRVLSEGDSRNLAEEVKEDEVRNALRLSKNQSAPGLDGIPYEFYKQLNEQFKEDTKKKRKAFDILNMLTRVFQHLEKHGPSDTSKFTDGWMNPIYKKKDREDIANYRPITLLNTDYKMYTKVLALRLAQVVPSIIHQNQAGFIPGRTILDQTQLVQMVIEYADIHDINGAVVALDQEKAYDKIDHTYLWATLRKYGLPEPFITNVKHLYANATTQVMINGHLSAPFKVVRGVRQGDPLSCLLFIIAIEPLLTMLRVSPNIKGLEIPGTGETLKAMLFTDETTAYLAQSDSFEDLMELTKTWCRASRAHFNETKTEVIPIGEKNFRAEVKRTRQISPGSEQEKIPEEVRIAKDGDAVRILGARVGNELSTEAVWNGVLDKVNSRLESRAKQLPDMTQKRIYIGQDLVATTQYHAATHGTPKEVNNTLTRSMRNFIWGEKQPTIGMKTLQLPREQGGLGLTDLKRREKAIWVMKLKRYLNFDKRPTWAYFADAILAKAICSADAGVAEQTRINPFLQNWTPSLRNLPQSIKGLLKIAKETSTRIEVLRPSNELRNALPAWLHIGAVKTLRKITESPTGRCLRKTRSISSVGDLCAMKHRYENGSILRPHYKRRNCTCEECRRDRCKGCANPSACLAAAEKLLLQLLRSKWDPLNTNDNHDGLTLTIRRRTANENPNTPAQAFTFDPTVLLDGGLTAAFRTFTDPKATCREPALRRLGIVVPQETVRAYTDGSCIHNGTDDATAGSGIFYGQDDQRNKAIKVPRNLPQTNNTGELIAALQLVRNTPNFAPLQIVADSKLLLDGLRKHHRRWEDDGFIGTPNAEIWRPLLAALRTRSAPTHGEWVKGHSKNFFNDGADRLANEGARKEYDDEVSLEIDPRFNLTGARLDKMTQAKAYKALAEREPRAIRDRTESSLREIKGTLKTISGLTPSDRQIWKSIWCKDFSRRFQAFQFLHIHEGYKVGKYWRNIPGYEHRQFCQVCGGATIDSLQHILVECQTGERAEIWRLTKQLWAQKHPHWLEPSEGLMKGFPLVEFQNPRHPERKMSGTNRLYRILMAETIHLTWKLRCE